MKVIRSVLSLIRCSNFYFWWTSCLKHAPLVNNKVIFSLDRVFVKWFFLFLTISYSKLVRIDAFPMTNMIKWMRHVIYLCVWMSSNLHYCWDRWSFEKVSTQGIFSQWKLDQKITFEIHIKSMKNNSFWTWFCWRLIPYWEQRANFEEKSNISIHFSYFHVVLAWYGCLIWSNK